MGKTGNTEQDERGLLPYHYRFCAVVARKLLNLLPGAVLVARLSRQGKENPAGIVFGGTRL